MSVGSRGVHRNTVGYLRIQILFAEWDLYDLDPTHTLGWVGSVRSTVGLPHAFAPVEYVRFTVTITHQVHVCLGGVCMHYLHMSAECNLYDLRGLLVGDIYLTGCTRSRQEELRLSHKDYWWFFAI